MKKLFIFLLLVVATGVIFGQDTITNIKLDGWQSTECTKHFALKWNDIPNDTTTHSIIIFGINEEGKTDIIDSIANVFTFYRIQYKKVASYRKIFIGFRNENTFIRSNFVSNVQKTTEITYNWDKENHICSTGEPLHLSTIIDGEWSGAGVANNVFYPATVPAGSTIKLLCNKKEFIVVVVPPPYVSLGWVPKEVKVGFQQIQLTGYPVGGKWSVNGESCNGYFDPNTVGLYEVIYFITDEYGCTSGIVEHIVVK